jgi:3-hydroxybutyryl-CoA dehydrogenase
VSERLAIAGSGAIACGLAAVAATQGHVTVFARSEGSCDKANAKVRAICERLGASVNGNVHVSRDPAVLADATFVVEAIVEDPKAKAEIWKRLGEHLADLIELAFPDAASETTRARARALCEALGKTAVEVPDTPGFVVNRLLFPFLFEAVRLMERTGLEAEAIDTCMRLGAGHPMGPLALLDLVGLDVSAAIARTIGVEVPARVEELIAAGALGRKTGVGFHTY